MRILPVFLMSAGALLVVACGGGSSSSGGDDDDDGGLDYAGVTSDASLTSGSGATAGSVKLSSAIIDVPAAPELPSGMNDVSGKVASGISPRVTTATFCSSGTPSGAVTSGIDSSLNIYMDFVNYSCSTRPTLTYNGRITLDTTSAGNAYGGSTYGVILTDFQVTKTNIGTTHWDGTADVAQDASNNVREVTGQYTVESSGGKYYHYGALVGDAEATIKFDVDGNITNVDGKVCENDLGCATVTTDTALGYDSNCTTSPISGVMTMAVAGHSATVTFAGCNAGSYSADSGTVTGSWGS